MPTTEPLQHAIQKCEEALTTLVTIKGLLSQSAALDTGIVNDKLNEAKEALKNSLAQTEFVEHLYNLYGVSKKIAVRQVLFCDVTPPLESSTV